MLRAMPLKHSNELNLFMNNLGSDEERLMFYCVRNLRMDMKADKFANKPSNQLNSFCCSGHAYAKHATSQ